MNAPVSREHVRRLRVALEALEEDGARTLDSWGVRLARILASGGRLLVAGNGGSAALAQHLTGELVGRYVTERQPLSAIALHAETTSLTAIVNDYGADECFARQVRAHGRAGDVLLLMSTSGTSPNVLLAAEAGHETGMHVWGLTGAAGSPLQCACDSIVAVPSTVTSTIQEVHQVAVHLLCEAVDASLAAAEAPVARATA